MNHTNGVFAAVLRPSILVAAFSALMAGFAPDIEATELGDRGLTQASRSGRPTLGASASEMGAEVWFGAALSLSGPGLEDDTRLRVLRPIDWFEERGLSRPGDRVFLELPELGVSGWASLESMWEHGPLEPGPGRLVLSTTETTSNDVYELSFIEDAEALRGTGSHPLYSLDRDDWVRVRDLQVGERLQTAEGAVTVEALEKVRGVLRVYNLEVDADHEYLVGEAGVRAHNACPGVRNTTPSPALPDSPYNPDVVSARSAANRALYDTVRDRAANIGFGQRIAPQKAPFNSHGQDVFFDGRRYITRDVDARNVTDGWKMFDRRGRRTGTYNSDLSERIGD